VERPEAAQASARLRMDKSLRHCLRRANIARYTVLTYVRSGRPRRGPRAKISADMATYLLSSKNRTELRHAWLPLTRPLRRQSNTGAVLDQHPVLISISLVRGIASNALPQIVRLG